MILAEIKNYLQQRGQASLNDIAIRFDTPPTAVQGMLEVWIRKGRVRRILANAACGSSCTQCDPASAEIYQWVGAAGPNNPTPLPQPTNCKRP